MIQNRAAPAYQEYAASMLARREFRLMSLAERGLLFTMRLECWINKTLPTDHKKIARLLGIGDEQIESALPAVMAFFEADGNNIRSPELDGYRALLDDRRERMSGGGKRSAEAKNSKRKNAARRDSVDGASTLPSTLQAPRQGTGKLSVQSKPEKQNQKQPPGEGVSPAHDLGGHDEWVADYAAAESCTADEYDRLTGG